MTITRKREIDWAALRLRLGSLDLSQVAGTIPGSPEARAVLDARARALARPVATTPTGQLDVLTFELARERYGIESRFVQAIFPLRQIAPLPGASAPIHGVTGWRGKLLTVLELRAMLGLSLDSLNDLARVIVLGHPHPVFGILADAVHTIVPVALAGLHPLPVTAGSHRKYLRGITADALQILDVTELLHLLDPETPE